jgi:sRNA-binding protein
MSFAKIFAISGCIFFFSGCAAQVEAPDAGSLTDSLIESGREQAQELKGEVLDTKAEIKAGVDDIKNAATEVREAQEAIGAIGSDNEDAKISPSPTR